MRDTLPFIIISTSSEAGSHIEIEVPILDGSSSILYGRKTRRLDPARPATLSKAESFSHLPSHPAPIQNTTTDRTTIVLKGGLFEVCLKVCRGSVSICFT